MIRCAVLGSTRGSNLPPILEAIKSGELDASVEVVISNKADSGILEKATNAGIPAEFVEAGSRGQADGMTEIESRGMTAREAFDRKVHALLSNDDIDLIVMIGYMRIVSPWFVQQWEGRMINVHPSLLPKHKGLMNLQVHQAVLDAKETETGCSVHLVTEGVDEGKVLVQKTCTVSPDDTAESLKAKVQALEAGALVEAISVFQGQNNRFFFEIP